MPVLPKFCPEKLAEFLVETTKLNLLDKRLSYGTEYGGSVAVRLLEYYQQSRKILKAVVSMKSAVSEDWLGLGATQAAMSFGT